MPYVSLLLRSAHYTTLLFMLFIKLQCYCEFLSVFCSQCNICWIMLQAVSMLSGCLYLDRKKHLSSVSVSSFCPSFLIFSTLLSFLLTWLSVRLSSSLAFASFFTFVPAFIVSWIFFPFFHHFISFLFFLLCPSCPFPTCISHFQG